MEVPCTQPQSWAFWSQMLFLGAAQTLALVEGAGPALAEWLECWTADKLKCWMADQLECWMADQEGS